MAGNNEVASVNVLLGLELWFPCEHLRNQLFAIFIFELYLIVLSTYTLTLCAGIIPYWLGVPGIQPDLSCMCKTNTLPAVQSLQPQVLSYCKVARNYMQSFNK